MTQLEEKLFHSSLGPQWSQIGAHHHHGIDLPLSALHSENSCGIGEFYDLIPLIDWCKEVGFDVIQLLPINDTGDDPSPYFALSAMALSPLFLSLYKLPGVKKSDLSSFLPMNRLAKVPYHDVQSHKLLFLRTYFEKKGARIVKEESFSIFVDENPWVETYALFKVLKDVMAKNHWKTWPQELQAPTEKQFDALIEKYWIDVCFYIFLQYLCFEQLCAVKKYANKKGVLIKGDIPILISPDSADVWKYTDEFDLSFSAGAPPDAYNENGQVWGLPIFHWEVMKERGFDWWKTRLDYAQNFYDLYRIDHVLGFFRIFAIPLGKSAKNGLFLPADKAEWLPHGREILSVLCDHSPMLPIAEDLGAVPDSVRTALTDLGICGTKVMRWEKRKNNTETFIDPLHYNPISMTTVSTHDSETLQLWWQGEEGKSFAHHKGWHHNDILSKAQRREILWDSHHSSSLFHINLIGEYLALFPELVWDNPQDERINIPGTVGPHNWTYRIRPSVEELSSHPLLKQEIEKILE
ncbi:MAG: 4-alpha-glucanotransferase [Chlamydiae bacterium]|nr:4-alpha-glucanotransferase [Chlamydiota bacterium]